VLLGTVVVALVFFLVWPVYAGDSLMPRLCRVIRGALSLLLDNTALTPGEVRRISTGLTQVLSEILEVAEDARMEGRGSLINHDAVVQSAGTIRRMSHWLASVAVWRLVDPPPPLDEVTQAAEDAAFSAIRRRLSSWLSFYEGPASLSSKAAYALANAHSRDEIAKPLENFINRIEGQGFAVIFAWPLEQRRRMMDELQALRRLEFLLSELDTYLPRIPGAPPEILVAYAPAVAAQPPA
jgi:hypothetical protein